MRPGVSESEGEDSLPERSPGLAARIAAAAARHWHAQPIRRRILIAAATLNLAAIASAGIVVVVNARVATSVEITASLDASARFVRTTVAEMRADVTLPALATAVSTGMPARHVRIVVLDADGRPVAASTPADWDDDDADEGAPGWFAWIVGANPAEVQVPVVVGGERMATVVLAGEPADEIAEVWEDVRALAIIALVVNIAVLFVLAVAVGRALVPLSTLARGLFRLEEGDYRARLERPRDVEFALIADRFNALAEQLATTRAENRRLSLRLLSAQDDERRVVAGELHDEAGPCLFGIVANARSIETIARGSRAARAPEIVERAREVADIADRLKTVNRRLLQRLRPMSLGHVPLADLATGLVDEFRRLAPSVLFDLAVGELADGYGEARDLTVYRCLQECLTNAVKHAEPRIVMVELAERRAGARGARLHLSVEDDGIGMDKDVPAGYGLSGIEERVRALGGALAWGAGAAGGTRFEIELPLGGDGTAPGNGEGEADVSVGFGERVR
jgi:two-component system sensor histidine kinase UhpB